MCIFLALNTIQNIAHILKRFYLTQYMQILLFADLQVRMAIIIGSSTVAAALILVGLCASVQGEGPIRWEAVSLIPGKGHDSRRVGVDCFLLFVIVLFF